MPRIENYEADAAATSVHKAKGTVAFINQPGGGSSTILGAVVANTHSHKTEKEEELVNVSLEDAKKITVGRRTLGLRMGASKALHR